MENHQIPDSAISASSERIYYLRASQGRLRMRSFFRWLPAGWSAGVSNKKQWFQIKLGEKTKVTGIATQGLNSRWSPDQWVTSYQVSYKGNRGSQWKFYKTWGLPKVHFFTLVVDESMTVVNESISGICFYFNAALHAVNCNLSR